ncbi:MAG: glycosyl transferase [Gammaproteobacteria bacterium]|nr:glycosyl transferase [Gammaproteobacteria bacterium]
MADFHQNGVISTLHNISNRSFEELESELIEFSKERPIELILPSLYSEIEGPALKNIVKILSNNKFLNHITIGLDKANKTQFQDAKIFFKDLKVPHSVIWNDGPRMKSLDNQLSEQGLAPKEPGKGKNVWYCMGYILARDQARSIAIHDCDILTYNKELLARLIYPVANPLFDYEFCKGYYPRLGNNKLNGRVTRLLVTPLLKTFKKVLGHRDYIEFIDVFRYPLAGEFSFRSRLLKELRIPSDWGLEIGILSEMQRNQASNRICQVDISDAYDHKHQELSQADKTKGLSKMSIDISKTLIRKLAAQGDTFTSNTLRTIKATYYRTALDLLEIYNNDAKINGLSLDINEEEIAIELFSNNIIIAGQEFLENPNENPLIPNWNRVQNAIPDFKDNFIQAVKDDSTI